MKHATPIESLDELPEPPTTGDDATNELVVSHSTYRRYQRECCQYHLEHSGAERAILYVVYAETPEAYLEAIRVYEARSPIAMKVILTSGRPVSESGNDGGLDVRTLTDPGDLPRLGVAISDALSDWAAQPTAVCFYSLSNLLQVVELSRAFRFIHTLCSRIASGGSLAHYHLHPDLHEDQVVATMRPLFDSVVTLSGDGAAE